MDIVEAAAERGDKRTDNICTRPGVHFGVHRDKHTKEARCSIAVEIIGAQKVGGASNTGWEDRIIPRKTLFLTTWPFGLASVAWTPVILADHARLIVMQRCAAKRACQRTDGSVDRQATR